jgi:hypothetical protein
LRIPGSSQASGVSLLIIVGLMLLVIMMIVVLAVMIVRLMIGLSVFHAPCILRGFAAFGLF